MKKLLVSLMLIIATLATGQQLTGTTSGTALDPSQVYTTGNIVQPTVAGTNQTPWVNGVYQDQLTCWGWGNPGYCGPDAIVRPGNNINFSYGMTDLYQVQSIANVLPGSGAGLRVNGFNFGFLAKNGNGWDDARQDYLTAYVSFYGIDGKVKDYTNFDMNSKFDWTRFNYSKDFVTPYATKDLSTVRYGFVGMDNNYWAGPYGPEIYDVSFSLKYSVDPCAVNVLSSPTCPGYLDALTKLLPTTTVESTPITTTSTSALTTTTVTVEPTGVTTNTTTTVGQPTVVSPVVSAPTTTSSDTPTANAQTSSQSNKETSSSNTSLALSIISKNQDRDNAALSVAQTATSQAQSAAQQAQQEAASIAANAVTNSQNANIVSVNGQQSLGSGIKINNTSTNTNSLVSNSVITPGIVTISALNPQLQTSGFVTPTTTTINIEQIPTPQVNIVSNTNTISANAQTYSIVLPNFLTDKTNPLSDIVEGKQTIPQTNATALSGPTVNKNAQDNDVAGGVDINRMALAPTGYSDYLNFTLRDATFYAPKEVYRNQRNVDNSGALRQMTNDSKHKEMVEMQYVK